MLQTIVVLLGVTTLAVPLSRRLGFGSIVGYLIAGTVIGPSGLRLVTNVGQISSVAAFGVIMLLFLIGLELRPHRLWILRKPIFGLGLGQMIPSAAVLTALVHLAHISWLPAALLGTGLALSSTAIVLPMLSERDLLSSPAGRDSFAVLLFQDLAFIPLVALVPLLAHGTVTPHSPWLFALRGVLAIIVILAGGSLLVPRLFRVIGGAKTPEIFTATALFLVAGTAALANWAGLSMSLGAFMAGVLLSDSEYRHELQADIEPFESLLLGFFFISIGMSTDLSLAARHPVLIALSVAVLILAKSATAFLLGLVKRKSARSALRFALALPEGSEFSFVLFAAAVGSGLLSRELAALATLVVALSMVGTPILFAAAETLVIPRLGHTAKAPPAEPIGAPPSPVIICGFGRMGQIVGRVLRAQKISFTALDRSPAQIEVVRRFGNKVYFGDPRREEVLRAAGAEAARILVVTLDDMDDTLRTVEMAKRHFPNLTILARARNRRHAHLLMDAGITGIIRETFYSSLKLTELVLESLGIPHAHAHRVVDLFREQDERILIETHAIAGDEHQLIQSTQQAAAELLDILESDRNRQAAETVD